MTVKEFANINGISTSSAKKMAPYINGATQCPCCEAWTIPNGARPIYIPDKRKYGSCAKPYCYVLDAIALGMDLNQNVLNMDEEKVKTVVRELRKHELIVLREGCDADSLYHLDYIISLKYAEWNERKSQEKTKLIFKTVKSCADAMAKGAEALMLAVSSVK